MARASTNWIKNPSFETDTDHWAIANATLGRTLDFPFSGSYAALITATGSNNPTITYPELTCVPADAAVYAAVRVLAHQPDCTANLIIDYTYDPDCDEEGGVGAPVTTSTASSGAIAITTDEFEWTTIECFAQIDSGGNSCNIRVVFIDANGNDITDSYLMDAVELRINENLDGYFDGDTTDCYWDDTPHDSISIRVEVARDNVQSHASYGYELAYRIWTVDEDYNDDVELTNYLTGGSITIDVDEKIKRSASFEFKDLSVLTPFVTRLRPYMERYHEGVLIDNEPLGLFSIAMPDGVVTYLKRSGTVEAFDITSELVDSARGVPITYTKSQHIVDQAEVRVTAGRGYKANFPSDSKKFKEKQRFPQWIDDLELVNTLLTSANFNEVYGDGMGIMVTDKIKKLSQMQPIVSIPAHLVFGIKETNNFEKLCNVVKVYKDNPDGTPIYAIRRNDDEDDPVSTVNMGFKTVVINDSEVESQSAANDLAEATLEEGRSYEKTLDIDILPHPKIIQKIHSVLSLTFDQKDGTCYCGKYWIRKATLPLGNPYFMTVSANRTISQHNGVTS